MHKISVLILANGLSSRLNCNPPDAKTFTPVSRRPIIAWLMDELRGSEVVDSISLHLRPGVVVPSSLGETLGLVSIHRQEPRGYFFDVIDALSPGARTVVIDSDLAAPPGSVRNFIRAFASEDCDLAVGYQYVGDKPRGRDIWIELDSHGRVDRLSREEPSTGFATVGIFGWTPSSYARAVHWVRSEHSVTRFIGQGIKSGLGVRALPFAAAINVNSNEDVDAAEAMISSLIPKRLLKS